MTTPAKKKLSKKICLLGSYRVGKTSLVRRFVSSIYDEAYHVTLGVKIDKKLLSLDAADVELMIWDIAGAEDKSARCRIGSRSARAGKMDPLPWVP